MCGMQRGQTSFAPGVDGKVKTLYSEPHSAARDVGPGLSSTEAQIVKPSNVIRTHRPEKGPGAFVHAALGFASMGSGVHTSTQGFFVPASYCWLDRAEDQVHPGEGSA